MLGAKRYVWILGFVLVGAAEANGLGRLAGSLASQATGGAGRSAGRLASRTTGGLTRASTEAARSVRRTARQGGTVSQAQLRAAYAETAARQAPATFRKAETTIAYRIPDDAQGLADLPPSIRNHLGEVDSVTGYTDDLVRQNRGQYAVLNVTDGRRDFYLPQNGRELYIEASATVPGAAQNLAQVRGFVDDGVELVVLQRRAPAEMLPAQSVGATRQGTVIEAPWGGTQTVEAGGRFVRNGDEVYVVNADRAGNPIGYVPVTDDGVRTILGQSS